MLPERCCQLNCSFPAHHANTAEKFTEFSIHREKVTTLNRFFMPFQSAKPNTILPSPFSVASWTKKIEKLKGCRACRFVTAGIPEAGAPVGHDLVVTRHVALRARELRSVPAEPVNDLFRKITSPASMPAIA